MVNQTFEGTWEEISRHAPELAGRRVRLTVLTDVPANGTPLSGTSLAEALKDYIGKFSSGTPHNDARDAKKIWAEHVEEKHRRRQERQP